MKQLVIASEKAMPNYLGVWLTLLQKAWETQWNKEKDNNKRLKEGVTQSWREMQAREQLVKSGKTFPEKW